jgi:hypothetical protein
MTGAAQLIVLALVDDASELNGATIAKLLPSVRTSLSIRDQLVAAFDFTADAAEDVTLLEARIAPLEERLESRGRKERHAACNSRDSIR